MGNARVLFTGCMAMVITLVDMDTLPSPLPKGVMISWVSIKGVMASVKGGMVCLSQNK